jgi:hypothetical protein
MLDGNRILSKFEKMTMVLIPWQRVFFGQIKQCSGTIPFSIKAIIKSSPGTDYQS